jgi:hypothetical protein
MTALPAVVGTSQRFNSAAIEVREKPAAASLPFETAAIPAPDRFRQSSSSADAPYQSQVKGEDK